MTKERREQVAPCMPGRAGSRAAGAAPEPYHHHSSEHENVAIEAIRQWVDDDDVCHHPRTRDVLRFLVNIVDDRGGELKEARDLVRDICGTIDEARFPKRAASVREAVTRWSSGAEADRRRRFADVDDPSFQTAVNALQAFEELERGRKDYAISLLEKAARYARRALGAETCAELLGEMRKKSP